MAATREQGISLTGFLIGFTALPAGIYLKTEHPAPGVLVAIIGALIMIGSVVQMIRLKPLELMEDKGGKE